VAQAGKLDRALLCLLALWLQLLRDDLNLVSVGG
jgi:hypothetical protein